MTQAHAAELAEVSDTTWNQLENGRGPQPSESTKVGICQALGWTPDSVDRICRGEDPVLVEAVAPNDIPDAPTVADYWERVEAVEATQAQHGERLDGIEKKLDRIDRALQGVAKRADR